MIMKKKLRNGYRFIKKEDLKGVKIVNLFNTTNETYKTKFFERIDKI